MSCRSAKTGAAPAADADRHILLLRVHLEHVHAFLCKREQIQIFILHILFPAIELGKLDDIVIFSYDAVYGVEEGEWKCTSVRNGR